MGAQTPFHQFMTDNAKLVGFNLRIEFADYGNAAYVYALRGPRHLAMVCVPTDVSDPALRDGVTQSLLTLRLAAETSAKYIPEYSIPSDADPEEYK